MEIKGTLGIYDAPKVELISFSSPLSVLNALSYPGEIDGEFEDLVNQPDWFEG